MPALKHSRYTFAVGLKDANGNVYLTDPEPFRYREAADNRYHKVVRGDTYHSLAERYFAGAAEDPAQLWWIIPWYQPEPIVDPTLTLTPGRQLVIPSLRMVTQEAFNESRAEEF